MIFCQKLSPTDEQLPAPGTLLDGHAEAGVLGGILPVALRGDSCHLLSYQGWSPCKYHGKEVTSFVKQFFACNARLAICLALVTKYIQG